MLDARRGSSVLRAGGTAAVRQVLVAGLALAALAAPAVAKDATCYTSDDGEYPCRFTVLDDAGSFRIEGKGKPSFEVWIDAPGEAFVSAEFGRGGRSVALPGPYLRSEEDGACWVNPDTEAELCAW